MQSKSSLQPVQRPALQKKDIYTILNALAGIGGIAVAITGNAYASVYIVFAIIFDFLDGREARKTKTENEFGKQLDSLADVVSFLVAPTILVMLQSVPSVFVVFSSALFVATGLVRLAWFNLQQEKGVYFGLPTPAAALLAVTVNFFIPSFNPVALIILSALMIAPFRLKKL